MLKDDTSVKQDPYGRMFMYADTILLCYIEHNFCIKISEALSSFSGGSSRRMKVEYKYFLLHT